ncbi:MAG: biotin--[acetyl-CoA-carboxylase] ligase [Nitrospirota bacterium]|nr:biotin--[acetyl-CoA-carboxylase] ligase [Nitrospirota bacterium]
MSRSFLKNNEKTRSLLIPSGTSIIELLQGADAFISGQEISNLLGISRAAVWKKILTLRNKGYVIEALPSKGYCLKSAPDLAHDYLLMQIKSDLWKDIIIHGSVESTNDLAMSLATKGEIPPGRVLIADHQTRGKGRLGRTWESPAGANIYMSLIIRPELEPKDTTMLTILAGVAGALALQRSCSIPVSIKWPNDLVIADKKLGGILTEVRADPDRVALAVIGIGINVNMEYKGLPEVIRNIATSVKIETGKNHPRNGIIIQLLREFELWYTILKKKGKKPLLDAWRKNSSTLGRKVNVAMQHVSFSGIAEDIDDNGMLVLKMRSGERKTISSGDISFLP